MSSFEIDPVLLLILGVGVVGVILVILVMTFGEHLPLVRDLFNNGSLRSGREVRADVLNDLAANKNAESPNSSYLHQEGIARTYLRPAGKVQLDSGELIDVVTQGELLKEKTRVRVIDTGMNHLVVAEVEA